MAWTPRKARGFRIAAICFFLVGLIWCIVALTGESRGVNVALGSMNICVGAAFLAISFRKQRQAEQQTTGKTGPD